MLTFITIVHVFLCVFMIFVILLQPGKDAGMGAALGGGVATTAFGGRGAVTFLSKLTAVCAGLFFLTSLGLSFVGLRPSVAAQGITKSARKPPASTGAAQAGADGGAEAPLTEMEKTGGTPPAPVGAAADGGALGGKSAPR
jgi:preprotein translocase subunit SecG